MITQETQFSLRYLFDHFLIIPDDKEETAKVVVGLLIGVSGAVIDPAFMPYLYAVAKLTFDIIEFFVKKYKA